MSESRKRETVAEKLLALDPPPDADRQRHNEVLFAKLEQRVRRDKVIGGGVYLLLFLAAFWALLRSDQIDDPIRSAAWATTSLHILLWFLVYFLRGIYRLLATVTEGDPRPERGEPWKHTDRLISLMAVIVFLANSAAVYRLFSSPDVLRAVESVGHILWAPVFFLFWYPFGTGSLVARLWLDYKKTHLCS